MQPAGWREKLVYALLWFIPRANPDFEVRWPHVRRWYVEVDDSGVPVRELGLDANAMPISAGPWERNFGFWTDSGQPLPEDRSSEIDRDEFETMWRRFASLHAPADL
ncbi:MAG TPA: hypothetical protein VH814_21585 [Steroidobacteraceae bacterium]